MVMDAPPPVDGNDAPAPPRGPVRTAVDLAVDVVGRPAAEAVKPAVAAFKDAYPRGGSVVDDVARTVGGAAERVTTVADEAIAQRVQRAQKARAEAERAAVATKADLTRRSRAVVDAAAAELSAEEVTRVSSTGVAFLSALAAAVAHIAHRGLDVADSAADALSIARPAPRAVPAPGPAVAGGAAVAVGAEPSYAAVVSEGPAVEYPSEGARLARRALALTTRLTSAGRSKYVAMETARSGSVVGGVMRTARDAAGLFGGVVGGVASRATAYSGVGGPFVRGVASAVVEVVGASSAEPPAAAPTATVDLVTTPVPPPSTSPIDRTGESVGVMDVSSPSSTNSLSTLDGLGGAGKSIVA